MLAETHFQISSQYYLTGETNKINECKFREGHDTLGTIDKGNVNVALIGLHACCWHLLVPFHSSKIPYLSEKGTSK